MTAEAKVSIEWLIARARAAQEPFILADQSSVDEAVCVLAWSVYKPEHARELAELAVADKGLGNVPDKIVEKQRKTLGTLRDLLRVKSVGIIEEMPALGIVKYAKPVGAVTPSTNPAATPVNKAMMAVKGAQRHRHRTIAAQLSNVGPYGGINACRVGENRCAAGPGPDP